jgi:hypothetical protein
LEDNKKPVLFYLTEKDILTLEKASKDPRRLEESLTSLLGELGWTVVKLRILQEICGVDFEFNRISAETASLSEAFGFVRSFRPVVKTRFARF